MQEKIISYVRIFTELGKVRITLFVAVSTAFGYLVKSSSLNIDIWISTIGVFLLASGSSALNHFQERKTDALMERTKLRPIPSGKISGEEALIFSLILIIAGLLILLIVVNVIAFVLGLTALFWYNSFYTPLKRKFALAVVPGSLIGAIPPVIGFAAAGGNPLDPEILAVAAFFFIWQIPHFWLLVLIYGQEYEEAGFPSLSRIFNSAQLSRITFIWILALSFNSVLMPLFNVAKNPISWILLFALGIIQVIFSIGLLKDNVDKALYMKSFFYINIFILAVVFVISIDKLLLTEF